MLYLFIDPHCRDASTSFEEIQLAPSSIGISPLNTTHEPIFQHRSFQTSTWCYPSFILVIFRSPGFGSIKSDYIRPIQTCFRLGFSFNALTKTTSYKSPAHSSTGTLSTSIIVSNCLSVNGFMFYFTHLRVYFSPFPRSTISLSVIQEYLALRGGPRWFKRDSTCPIILGINFSLSYFIVKLKFFRQFWVFDYWTFTIYGAGFSRFVFHFTFSFTKFFIINVFPLPLQFLRTLGCTRFARHYSEYRFCFLFHQLLRCFSSLGCLCLKYEFNEEFKRLSYSGIFESKLAASSSKRFAGICALLRLWMPRYPPFTLISLTFFLASNQIMFPLFSFLALFFW